MLQVSRLSYVNALLLVRGDVCVYHPQTGCFWRFDSDNWYCNGRDGLSPKEVEAEIGISGMDEDYVYTHYTFFKD